MAKVQELKLGDTVRVLYTCKPYLRGYIGIITHLGSMDTWGNESAVYLDGEKLHHWIWDDYVEKIGGVGMFSVGDKVMIKYGVRSEDNSHHWGGDIGYIRRRSTLYDLRAYINESSTRHAYI